MVGCWGLLPSFEQANSVLGENATHIAIAEVLLLYALIPERNHNLSRSSVIGVSQVPPGRYRGKRPCAPWSAKNGKAVIILQGYLSHHRGYDKDLMEYTLL